MSAKLLLYSQSTCAAHSRQSFEAKIVPFNRFYPMAPSKSSIPVHNKGNMLRDRSLACSPNDELAELRDAPFYGGRL